MPEVAKSRPRGSWSAARTFTATTAHWRTRVHDWPADVAAEKAHVEHFAFRIFEPAGGLVLALQMSMAAGIVLASPLLIAEMFKAQPGGVAVVSAQGGSQIARLASIIPADPQARSALFDQTRKQLSQAIAGDMLQQYVGALEKDYGVTVNNALIEQQFGEK